MQRVLFAAGWLLAALVPAEATPQAVGDTAQIQRSPLELLLEHRDTLELTPEQLAQLDLIRDRLRRQNEPLVGRMLTMRQQWQRERLAAQQGGAARETPQLRRLRARAQPVHDRIQQNNRAAMQAVNRMLTPEQRQRLRGIVEQNRRGSGPPGPGGWR